MQKPPVMNIVPVNESPPRQDIRFRREILIQAQQLVQDIDGTEDQMEMFQTYDLPAFETWFQLCFAAESRQLDELEREYAAAVRFHNSMVALSKLRHVSMQRACELMHEEQAAYLAGDESARLKIDEERLRRDEFIRREFEDEVRTRVQMPASTDGLLSQTEGAAVEATADAGESLKAVYRKLVRRLHPDLQGPDAEAGELRWQKRIWNLAQQARQQGHVRELDLLYKVTRVRQMDFGELTVADAHDVYAWLRAELDRLSSELGQAQRHPAWGFTQITDLRLFEERTRQIQMNEIQFLREKLEELKGQHAYLEIISHRPDSRSRRGKRHADPAQLSLF